MNGFQMRASCSTAHVMVEKKNYPIEKQKRTENITFGAPIPFLPRKIAAATKTSMKAKNNLYFAQASTVRTLLPIRQPSAKFLVPNSRRSSGFF